MILLIDNFDSFTFILNDYFNQLGLTTKVVKNNLRISEIERLKFDGIVISPGPGTPDNAGNVLNVIERFKGRKPILGICLGHQAIGTYFGAKLITAKLPMHGKQSDVFHSNHYLFDSLPSKFSVTRYHSLILDDLKDNLIVTSKTVDNEIMSISHNKYHIDGIQFHPEAFLTQNGIKILENWITFNKIEPKN